MSFSPTQALPLLQLQEGNSTVTTGSDFIPTNDYLKKAAEGRGER